MERLQRNSQTQGPFYSKSNSLASVQDNLRGKSDREQNERAHSRMGLKQTGGRHAAARPSSQNTPSLRHQVQSHQRGARQHAQSQGRS